MGVKLYGGVKLRREGVGKGGRVQGSVGMRRVREESLNVRRKREKLGGEKRIGRTENKRETETEMEPERKREK